MSNTSPPTETTNSTTTNSTITTDESTTTSITATSPITSTAPISSSPTTNGSSDMSYEMKVGIGVPVSFFVIFAVLLALFLLRRQWKKKNTHPPPVPPAVDEIDPQLKFRESDPSYADPQRRPDHYVNIDQGRQGGSANPAYEGDTQDDTQDDYEVPMVNEAPPFQIPEPDDTQDYEEPQTPPGAAAARGGGGGAGGGGESDSEDYLVPEPRREGGEGEEGDTKDYENPDHLRRPQLSQCEDQHESFYFSMTGTQTNPKAPLGPTPSSQYAQPSVDAGSLPRPCKPVYTGYVNDPGSASRHHTPALYQNLSEPNLSASLPNRGRPPKPPATKQSSGGASPQEEPSSTRGRAPKPLVAKQSLGSSDIEQDPDDSYSYENVPDKRPRKPKS